MSSEQFSLLTYQIKIKYFANYEVTAHCSLLTAHSMNMDKPHKKLIAWQKCMDLVVLIYEITRGFPKEETYGLVSQMRRASVSAPSNIAEGAADRSKEQFRNFLSIAIGSLNELNTQIEISFRVGYLNTATYEKTQRLVDECLAVTYGLKRSLEQN